MKTYINALPAESEFAELADRFLASLVGVGQTGWLVDFDQELHDFSGRPDHKEFVVELVREGEDGADGIFVSFSTIDNMVAKVKEAWNL